MEPRAYPLSFNIDDTSENTRPVHSTLLPAEIPIIEHTANLAALPVTGFQFTAAPPMISGMGHFRSALTPFCRRRRYGAAG